MDRAEARKLADAIDFEVMTSDAHVGTPGMVCWKCQQLITEENEGELCAPKEQANG